MSKSKARWVMLRKAIVENKVTDDGDWGFGKSGRSFSSFNLFAKTHCNCVVKEDKLAVSHAKDRMEPCVWFCYTCKDICSSANVWIKHPDKSVGLEDVKAFNNTGNICIWPAEEVMAYYCVCNMNKFINKSVAELGGGSTCLAGMCVALNTRPSLVLLSDGNQKCIETLKDIVDMNKQHEMETDVSVSLIRWDKSSHYAQHVGAFDFVICADCLFFDEWRLHLVTTIHAMLKTGGTAMVFAPRRGRTLNQFVKLCSDKFSQISLSDHYCPVINTKHEHFLINNDLYDADIHFPILIELIK